MAVVVHLVDERLERFTKSREVPLSILGTTDRVQLELGSNAGGGKELSAQRDDLGVRHGRSRSDALDTDGEVLTIHTLCGTFIPKERTRVPKAYRRSKRLVRTVLDVGAYHAGSPFRTKRQRAAARIREGEHLLLDDNVRGLAGRPGEEVGVFEDGSLDPPVSVALEQPARK
jgi:hypothetical protein